MLVVSDGANSLQSALRGGMRAVVTYTPTTKWLVSTGAVPAALLCATCCVPPACASVVGAQPYTSTPPCGGEYRTQPPLTTHFTPHSAGVHGC